MDFETPYPFNAEQVRDDIIEWLRHSLEGIKKRGVVVGLSGGIDSSVVASLCVRALGPNRVVAIGLPEADSSPDSLELGRQMASHLEISFIVEDITAGLRGMGAYERRNKAVSRIFSEFRPDWTFKITLQSNPLAGDSLNIFRITLYDPEGTEYSRRLPLAEYLQIVAASNIKQRLRMTLLYFHAEMRNFAVAGTGNKNEHALGFFVKHGDGGADISPILNLYKTEVYKLADVLDVPQNIVNREPTTDTYPAECSQEEFFFRLPFETMDAIWQASEQGLEDITIAKRLHLDPEAVHRVINDIRQKQRSTEHLRSRPLAYPLKTQTYV